MSSVDVLNFKDKMARNSHYGYRINGIINAAQELLKEKVTLLEGLVAEHKTLSEEKKQGDEDYLEALHQNSIILLNQQVMKPKVDKADATLSSLEDKNDALEASVKQVERRIGLLALSGSVDPQIMDFEEQTEKYKQNYLDIKEYCFAENLTDNISNISLEIMAKEAENEKVDQEFASLVAMYNKYVDEGYSELTKMPYEDFKLAVSTLNMIVDENVKAKAYLQDLKDKLNSSTVTTI